MYIFFHAFFVLISVANAQISTFAPSHSDGGYGIRSIRAYGKDCSQIVIEIGRNDLFFAGQNVKFSGFIGTYYPKVSWVDSLTGYNPEINTTKLNERVFVVRGNYSYKPGLTGLLFDKPDSFTDGACSWSLHVETPFDFNYIGNARIHYISDPPTISPTFSPTASTTFTPTQSPSISPTLHPTASPSFSPNSPVITEIDTEVTGSGNGQIAASTTILSSLSPTTHVSNLPSSQPSKISTFVISNVEHWSFQTQSPSESPTFSPSTTPTVSPSTTPTVSPSTTPTVSPSTTPTVSPTTTPNKVSSKPQRASTTTVILSSRDDGPTIALLASLAASWLFFVIVIIAMYSVRARLMKI